MPALQKQTQAVEAELQSLKMAAVDEANYLQLAESLAGFRSKLQIRAEALDIAERQQIQRLLVKEVLVGNATTTLRSFDPDTAIRTSVKRIDGPVFRRHSIKAESRLSFALGESYRRRWPTSTRTHWIENWRDEGYGSADT
jgi:hypothetical protein